MMNSWSELSSGWGWLLWFVLVFLFISTFGNLGYTYRAHRLYRSGPNSKSAIDILNERFAKGEISKEELREMRSEVQEKNARV